MNYKTKKETFGGILILNLHFRIEFKLSQISSIYILLGASINTLNFFQKFSQKVIFHYFFLNIVKSKSSLHKVFG